MGLPDSLRGFNDGSSRREFCKAVLAIGGSGALAACTRQTDAPDVPQGVNDPDVLPEQQHAWGNFLLDDEQGNPRFPRHQILLFLNYAGEDEPTDADRQQVEQALRTVERAYQWGARGQPHDALLYSGVLFTIGYSPGYFDRFDRPLPASVDLLPPEELLATLGEDATPDRYDAVMHVAADYPQFVLETELALQGEVESLNGVEMSATFEGVLEPAERRTGFMGRGLPEKRLDQPRIPHDAPLSMGFKSTFQDTVPAEEKVTIRQGPFADGTTQQVSRIAIDLPEWYDHSRSERTHRMFSPHHTTEEVGETAERLADDSHVGEEIAERTEEDAREQGVVGHQQKLARARDEDDDPRVLRRDFNATGGEGSVLLFDSWQRGIDDFLETTRAMYHTTAEDGERTPDDGDRTGEDGDDGSLADAHDGIVEFIETTNRATFLMPPRSLRALPRAAPER